MNLHKYSQSNDKILALLISLTVYVPSSKNNRKLKTDISYSTLISTNKIKIVILQVRLGMRNTRRRNSFTKRRNLLRERSTLSRRLLLVSRNRPCYRVSGAVAYFWTVQRGFLNPTGVTCRHNEPGRSLPRYLLHFSTAKPRLRGDSRSFG